MFMLAFEILKNRKMIKNSSANNIAVKNKQNQSKTNITKFNLIIKYDIIKSKSKSETLHKINIKLKKEFSCWEIYHTPRKKSLKY